MFFEFHKVLLSYYYFYAVVRFESEKRGYMKLERKFEIALIYLFCCMNLLFLFLCSLMRADQTKFKVIFI